jgi:hypothetical protein
LKLVRGRVPTGGFKILISRRVVGIKTVETERREFGENSIIRVVIAFSPTAPFKGECKQEKRGKSSG